MRDQLNVIKDQASRTEGIQEELKEEEVKELQEAQDVPVQIEEAKVIENIEQVHLA